MLYFENLSGVKEDEYFRDGITEDIITELSKIKGLKIFSRPTVLAYRDKPVTPAQIGQQLSAAYVLAGSLRRAGNRLRINAQLVDTADRLPALVGALRPRDEGRLRGPGRDRAQDRRGAAHHAHAAGAGGARRQADREPPGLRPLPAREELRAPADAAGPRVRAPDVRERGGARTRTSRSPTPRSRTSARSTTTTTSAPQNWIDRAIAAAAEGERAPPRAARGAGAPRPGSCTPRGSTTRRSRWCAQAIERKPDCEGAYYLLLRALFALGPLPGGRAPRRRGARRERATTTTSTCRS